MYSYTSPINWQKGSVPYVAFTTARGEWKTAVVSAAQNEVEVATRNTARRMDLICFIGISCLVMGRLFAGFAGNLVAAEESFAFCGGGGSFRLIRCWRGGCCGGGSSGFGSVDESDQGGNHGAGYDQHHAAAGGDVGGSCTLFTHSGKHLNQALAADECVNCDEDVECAEADYPTLDAVCGGGLAENGQDKHCRDRGVEGQAQAAQVVQVDEHDAPGDDREEEAEGSGGGGDGADDLVVHR